MFPQNKELINKGLLVFLIILCAFTCGIENENPRLSDNEIISFDFLAVDNEGIELDIIGKIDRTANTIILDLPMNVDKSHLFPSVSVSDGATISPDVNQAFDFSKQVIFTVIAEGVSRAYTVKVNNIEFLKSRILKFDFGKAKNNNLSTDVNGVVNHDSQYIYISPPCGTVGTKFVPTIEVSAGAKVSPASGKEQDFLNGAIYTVTSTEGDVSRYKVALANESSDRKALVDFYLSNPQSSLDWNIDAPMEAWRGVTLENCRVVDVLLSNKNIKNIPASFGDLSELRSLSVAFNQIESIPSEFGRLSKLEVILLDGNHLKSLPSELGDLESLVVLNLFGNQITEIPVGLNNLQNLSSLDLSDNKLTELPEELFAENKFKQLKYLRLHYNELKELPAGISNLTQLTELNVAYNQLEGLPDEIGRLGNLSLLKLHDNQLATLTESIVDLSSLTYLYVGNNKLSSLPQNMSRMTSLILLDLEGDLFTTIPVQLSDLPTLLTLRMKSNQISSIPPELGNLKSLQSLRLDNNKLSEIPIELAKLTALRYLSLKSNDLTYIPQEICDLRKTGTDVYIDTGVICR
ncbi:Leucine rich repeat-containing protein [Algoriphagus locisalis]|uniref:Leucine rich repeat-containing protein n=1 Tax=Algoriphagus locisalis TaxID=305507 RepID=A0A1I7CR55_9BACT|nr:leucine-rich repeat domain-containing protein [Algoriphagus locisalis]SFU01941.1 Leucine rich repeat-containing protein [Algoriphagus locisalis]